MNEKPHDHCLDIITAMTDQQPAQGAYCIPDRRDYFAILDQLEIEVFVCHSYLPAASIRRWPRSVAGQGFPAGEDTSSRF
jgi:hypothetical protein